MRTNSFALLGALLALLSVPAAARADTILGQGRIDNGGHVVLPGGPTLGTWSGGQFISTPNRLQLQGTGSTGDVSGMNVTAGGSTRNLASWLPMLATRASPTFTGTAIADNLSVAGKQALPLSLQSQPGTILASSYISAPSKGEGQMEFMDSGEMFVTTGATVTKLDPNNWKRARVAFYRSAIGAPGGGDVYGGNFVSISNVGHSGNNMTLELDNNSYSGNAATTFADLMGGLNVHSISYASGQTGTGSAADQVMSGVHLVNLAAGGLKPARVLGVYGGTVYGNLYDDNVTATGAVLASTGTKFIGFDYLGSTFTSGYFGRAPNNTAMAWRNGANTADVPAVLVDTLDRLLLGSGAAETQIAGQLNLSAILNNFNAPNDAAAAVLGVQPGHVYHTNGVLKVRLN